AKQAVSVAGWQAGDSVPTVPSQQHMAITIQRRSSSEPGEMSLQRMTRDLVRFSPPCYAGILVRALCSDVERFVEDSVLGGGWPFFTPKGWHCPAQGNALGNRPSNALQP